MKRTKNWQIWISTIFLVLVFLNTLVAILSSELGFAGFIGAMIGSYFISYIPIKTMLHYKKEVKNEKSN